MLRLSAMEIFSLYVYFEMNYFQPFDSSRGLLTIHRKEDNSIEFIT